ncbi:MAG TPA: GSU2403 family nucleotidyltransferase fold protein, partial [Stellaceae bacterium]|nr:GSU2403 family nucleotidyltransferase fold protein [Stellaceae bacterium]
YLVGEGARVKVPHPAWFAWHKLIVGANRPVETQGKALKDIAQSNELFQALIRSRPEDVKKAGRRLAKRGGSYVKKAREGAARLSKDTQQWVLPYLESK